MFGKLSLDAVPFHEPIVMVTIAGIILGGLALVGLITYFGKWTYLWKEWLTSVDHKRLGIMYIIVAIVMLLRGFADAIMMRSQQALASAGEAGFLPPHHYDQIFTAHGVIMIFFVAMPFVIGLMNLVVPLQIGARDVAFPFLNNLSFWFTVVGVILVNVSLGVGEFAQTGWLAYPPLSGIEYSPGVGVDYWIWSLQLSGIGTTLTGINFFVTILKMRAPGMTMFRLPIFVWGIFITAVLALLIFPLLLAAALGVLYDRKLGGHIYDSGNGGAILWQHLFWFFGHPEVYVIALPFFGIVSEVVPVFSRKPLFGYVGMVFAMLAIGALSMAVWAHHMFVTGAVLLPFFSFMTFLIAVPTGMKFFNWVGTMWKGHITWDTPMIWAMGFMGTFLFGGMTGVMLAAPALDFQLAESYFLIAHFHYTVFGTVVFSAFAGVYFWFPKMTGRMLDERLGKIHFWLTFIGFHGTFLIQHWVGNMGMPRRYADYLESDGFTIFNQISTVFSFILGASVNPLVWNVFKSYRYGEIVTVDDPWGYGNSLEWATSCPPPRHNFNSLPRIRSERPAFELHYPHMAVRQRAEAHAGAAH